MISTQTLFEGYLLSDKTIVCDWKKFERSGVIFIVGLSASGKSTLGKLMSYHHRIGYVDLDDLDDEIINYHEEKLNVEELPDYYFYNEDGMKKFYETMNILVKDKIKRDKHLVIEGIGIAKMFEYNLGKQILKNNSVIFLGTSMLRSALRGIPRNIGMGSTVKGAATMFTLGNREIKNQIHEFKKWRLNVPNTNVRPFNIHSLVPND